MMWLVKVDKLLSVCPDIDLTGIQTTEMTTLKARHPMKETYIVMKKSSYMKQSSNICFSCFVSWASPVAIIFHNKGAYFENSHV
jgi:hypothetical protein